MIIETTRIMKNFKYVLMVFAGGGMPEFSAKGLVLAFTVFGTTHSIALFSAGIPRIGAAAGAIIMTVELPVLVLCAAAVLGKRVEALQVAGIAAMLFGIALMNLRKARAG